MMTHYAPNTDGWEEWQRAYRYGVLLIFPPEPVLSQISALRASYDPQSQAACDAHISLTIPLPRPVSSAHWRELETIGAGFTRFDIRYGPLRHYLPYPGICLTIEPQDMLASLLAALEQASVFAGAPPRPYPFSAHMTIAEFISAEQTLALMDELADVAPAGIFRCTGVSYAVPDTHFHLTERLRLEFATVS